MDPAAIIGTVSAAISFVEFTGNIIKTVRDIAESKHGATVDNQAYQEDVQACQQRLQSFGVLFTAAAAKIVRDDSQDSSFDDARQILQQNIGNCKTLNDRLLSLLEKTTAQPSDHNSQIVHKVRGKLRSLRTKSTLGNSPGSPTPEPATSLSLSSVVRATLRTVWEKEEIKRLRQEWERCVDNVNDALQRFESIQGFRDLQQFGQDTLDQVKHLENLVRELLEKDTPVLRSFLDDYQKASSFKECVRRNQEWILGALGYDTMNIREEQVRDPVSNTFEWIFKSQEHTLMHWLAHGKGIYHVSGKPGSGKSTLMKLLEKEIRKHDLDFIFASFYSWRPFSDSHKWQVKDELFLELLLRSILLQILDRDRALIAIVFKQYWHPQDFTPFRDAAQLNLKYDDLSNAMNLIRFSDEAKSRHFFFLIDGLDEFFEPDRHSHFRLAAEINGWSSPNIKICVSSREETAFMSAFSKSNRIRLHEITEPDIRALVRQHFANYNISRTDQMPELSQKQRSALEEMIFEGAKGVFVWVVCTLSELSGLLFEGQNYDELVKTVNSFQAYGSLTDFLRRLISRIPPSEKKKAKLIFSIVVRLTLLNRNFHRTWYTLIHYWMATECLQQAGINASDDDPTPWAYRYGPEMSLAEAEAKVTTFRLRLPTITRGLLDVVDFFVYDPFVEFNPMTHKNPNSWDVGLQFAHRSVYDLLRTEYASALDSDTSEERVDATSYIFQSVASVASIIQWPWNLKSWQLVDYHKRLLQEILQLGSDENAQILGPFLEELDETLLQRHHFLEYGHHGDLVFHFPIMSHRSIFDVKALSQFDSLVCEALLSQSGIWFIKWAASDKSHPWIRSNSFKKFLLGRCLNIHQPYWPCFSIIKDTGLLSMREDIGDILKGYPPAKGSIWLRWVVYGLVCRCRGTPDFYMECNRLMQDWARLLTLGAEPRVLFHWNLTSPGLRPATVTTFESEDKGFKACSTSPSQLDKVEEPHSQDPIATQPWIPRNTSQEIRLDDANNEQVENHMNLTTGIDYMLEISTGSRKHPDESIRLQTEDARAFVVSCVRTYGTASRTVTLRDVMEAMYQAASRARGDFRIPDHSYVTGRYMYMDLQSAEIDSEETAAFDPNVSRRARHQWRTWTVAVWVVSGILFAWAAALICQS